MASHDRTAWLPRLAWAVAAALLPTLVWAAGRSGKSTDAGQSNAPETVEMFAAIEGGQIDVKLIPKDSTQCRVMIENKTNKTLTVQLPSAFAGVPVLAQAGVGGLGGLGRGNRGGGGMGGNNNNMNQGMGGGMGGMGMGGMGGMGGGGMGMGGGFMNVAPEKVGQLKVPTVCLDHGKADPRPGVKYKIVPIEQYTDKASVREVCQMLGDGKIAQRGAQAAAWHLNNNLSWQQLAAKELRFADGTSRPYFTPQEIRAGMEISAGAANLAEQRSNTTKQVSASQN